MPKLKIGTKLDRLYKLNLKKSEAEEAVKKINAKITEAEDDILDTIKKEDLEGAEGKLARCSINRSVVGNITDWIAFCKYMSRNKRWDMVQKRIALKAYRDTLESGKKVPGVEKYTKVSLSLTKIKK